MKKQIYNGALFPLLLVLYEIATYLTNDAYLPALPNIVNDLAANDHLAQLTLAIWFMGNASMQLILGPISDRYGRRPVLLIGGIMFLISTMICALTPNIETLLLARFIQGATVSSMLIAGYATIHELLSHDKAIHTLAWMFSITVLAPACGPLFGAIILHFANWRWIFGILVIWSTVILAVLFFKMPETNPNGHEKPIILKQVFIQYKRIFLNSNFMRPTLSFCFLFGAVIAWIVAGPFLVIKSFHHNAFEFGLIQILILGSFTVGTRFVKPLMKRYKEKNLIKSGLVIALSGGTLSILSTLIYPKSLILIIICLMLIEAGTGLSSPLLNRIAIESSSEPMGTRISMYSALMTGFGLIGSGLISIIYNGTLFSLAIVLFVFSLISFLLKGVGKI